MVQQLTKETAYKLDWERCRRVAKTVCYEAGINWEDKEDFDPGCPGGDDGEGPAR